jgi:transcriptional regulator with XRE-family HTH domain
MMRGMATEPRIGTRIRKRRQALGMKTQQELAERIGVDRTTVANWENDVHYPTRYIGALEDVLGVSLTSAEPDDPPPRDSLREQIARIEKLARDLRRQLEEDEDDDDGNGPVRRPA